MDFREFHTSKHWCENSPLAAAHFHNVGVARPGPWNTWVNNPAMHLAPHLKTRFQLYYATKITHLGETSLFGLRYRSSKHSSGGVRGKEVER